jgi:hypothetical protein
MEDVFRFGTSGTQHYAVMAESNTSFTGREVRLGLVKLICLLIRSDRNLIHSFRSYCLYCMQVHYVLEEVLKLSYRLLKLLAVMALITVLTV